MNIEQARFNMIEQQIRPWDVLEQDVLDLLVAVKRENFVPDAYKSLAFVDTEIPLPGGDAMLAPKVEARILQDAQIKKHESVLQIGAGAGYLTALLAHKARHVIAVEIDPELKTFAQKNLAKNGVTNAEVVLGDGVQGWSQDAPYDVIVISGAVTEVPQAILQQLKTGGRLMAIVGVPPVMNVERVTRTGDARFETVKLFETLAQPLRNFPQPSHFKF